MVYQFEKPFILCVVISLSYQRQINLDRMQSAMTRIAVNRIRNVEQNVLSMSTL